MASDKLRPSLLMVVMALMFCSVTAQDESIQDVYPDIILCDPNNTNYLIVEPYTQPFNIKSPGYPKFDYPDNLDCSLVVESFDDPLVLLFFFVDFSVEFQSDCNYDSLCLFGVRYCGFWETGFVFQNILPAFSRSTIRFNTDYSIRQRGFKLTVIPQLLMVGQTIQEVRGTGSSYSNINFAADTFNPRKPYNDMCALPEAVTDGWPPGLEPNEIESSIPTEEPTATETPLEI